MSKQKHSFSQYLRNEFALESIEEAVQKAETLTDAEIAPVIASQSARYDNCPVLILLTILFFILLQPLASNFFHTQVDWTRWNSIFAVVLAFASSFLVAVPLSNQQKLCSYFYSNAYKNSLCQLRAEREFTALRLTKTAKRNGVMIFVSLAEHHVSIIADSGILEKVGDEKLWTSAVDKMILSLKRKRIAQAFTEAIAEIEPRLSSLFPKTAKDTDELCNKLRILE